jgi:hypothetical protein
MAKKDNDLKNTKPLSPAMVAVIRECAALSTPSVVELPRPTSA